MAIYLYDWIPAEQFSQLYAKYSDDYEKSMTSVLTIIVSFITTKVCDIVNSS